MNENARKANEHAIKLLDDAIHLLRLAVKTAPDTQAARRNGEVVKTLTEFRELAEPLVGYTSFFPIEATHLITLIAASGGSLDTTGLYRRGTRSTERDDAAMQTLIADGFLDVDFRPRAGGLARVSIRGYAA